MFGNKELKKAMEKREEARNDFMEIANNKKTSESEITAFYKKYRSASDHLMAVYEKYQKKEGGACDQAA